MGKLFVAKGYNWLPKVQKSPNLVTLLFGLCQISSTVDVMCETCECEIQLSIFIILSKIIFYSDSIDFIMIKFYWFYSGSIDSILVLLIIFWFYWFYLLIILCMIIFCIYWFHSDSIFYAKQRFYFDGGTTLINRLSHCI